MIPSRRQAEKANKANEISDVLIAETKRTEVAVTAACVELVGLRKQIADYSAGGTPAGGSTTDAELGLVARERAAALGSVVATCTDEALEDARELEDLASQVRSLQTTYWGATGDHR